jgi:methyl-accepting chemotaxis protein
MEKLTQTTGKSLKFKLISLSIGITILLGVASVGVLRYIVKTQETAQLNGFEAYARSLSDAIGAQFYERYGDVQAFSISPAIQSSNKRSIVEMLNAWSAMYGIYDLIMLVDAKGRLVAVNDKGSNGKEISTQGLYQGNYSDAPWFKAVMSGEFTEDKDKNFAGTYVEDVQIDPFTTQVFGSNRLGSSFSAAVKNSSGKVVGVISNRAGARWFEVAFRELYAGLRKSGFAHSELTLLGKDGTVYFEYSSDPASERLSDPKYDWGHLLKTNLTDSKILSAQKVVAGQSGALLERSPKTQTMQIVGYVPVSGQKFIDRVGWSVLVKDDQSEAMSVLIRAQNVFYVVFAIVCALACGIAHFFAAGISTGISKRLSGLALRLSNGSDEVFSAATTISQSSLELSDAAAKQASAIQETVASIDEVSSMAKKSADNAAQSQKVSQSSRSAAEQGQEAMREMSKSISEISQSNTAIMTQVEDGNRQISEIVKVISEIGNKTKVINDIVFQTKLLSFNASVEAARAGEHGKGFAVVAEEVGNLAQMSGNAAKEISSMLDSSIHKVETIVNDTKTKVERLVVDSRSKVEVGIQVAQRCGEVLNGILSTVQEVDGMVGEISSASQEQAQGVSEINKSMNQLDQVTQQNSAIALSAASSAEQLSVQAEQLRQMVKDLFMVINGTASASQSSSDGGPQPREQAEMNERVPSRKVVPIGQKRAVPSKAAMPLKMAVGAESSSVPSKDDPRFEDV